jgi:hypothetical protein
MNERIKQLAEQANELDYETFDEYNHKTVQHYKFNKEKFAELIIQECMDCSLWVGKVNKNAVEPIHTAHAINLRIKKHLGFEE